MEHKKTAVYTVVFCEVENVEVFRPEDHIDTEELRVESVQYLGDNKFLLQIVDI